MLLPNGSVKLNLIPTGAGFLPNSLHEEQQPPNPTPPKQLGGKLQELWESLLAGGGLTMLGSNCFPFPAVAMRPRVRAAEILKVNRLRSVFTTF